LFSDIASGINFKRPGLQAVLERILNGSISHLVVAHRDRLARFGLDLLDWILAKHHCTLVVLHQSDSTGGPTELADDLMAVTTFFVAQHNGRRSAENRRRRRLGEAGEDQTSGRAGEAKQVKKARRCRQETKHYDADSYVPPTISDQELYARRAKVLPTPLQREHFDRWAGTCNFVYNLCVSQYREQRTEPKKDALRTLLKTVWKEKHPWIYDTPYEIRDAAIDDFSKIFKQQATIRKEKLLAGDAFTSHFDIKFRFKKHSSVSLAVRCASSYKTSTSEGGQVRASFYKRKMEEYVRSALQIPTGARLNDDIVFVAGKELPLTISHDSRLVRTPLGEYFFCYPLERPAPAHVTTSTHLRVVAGDPGVRTFNTFYDPDGCVVEIGAGDNIKLRNLGNAVDITKARISKYQKQKKKVKVRRMKRALFTS
jgi:hypothetical protein